MAGSRVTGAKDIAANFKRASGGLQTPINAASRKALRPMLAEAKKNLKANGSVESGDLLKSLAIKRDTKAPKMQTRFVIGPDPKKTRGHGKAHLVELGSAPHMIGNVSHPGASPKPFLRPAFDETQAKTVKIFGDSIGPEVEKAIARKARKK